MEKIQIRKAEKKFSDTLKKPLPRKSFALKNHLFSLLVGLIFAGIFCTGVYVYATYGTDEYYPLGNTLNPTNCNPGDPFCTVSIIPTQTGNSGKYLTTDGSVTSWATVSTGQDWTNATANLLTTGTGTFGTAGAVVLGGATYVINATGNTKLDGTLAILEGGSTPTYHTIFQGGDQSGDLTYTLPTASATGLLKNTAGVLSWDTTTYLTAEADTLSTVTGRGSITNGQSITVGPSATYDPIIISAIAKGAGSFTGTLSTADLTANKNWTLPNANGSVVVGSGVNTYLAYWSGLNTVTGNVNLTFDGTYFKTTIGQFSTGIYDTVATPIISIDSNNRKLYSSNGSYVMANWNSASYNMFLNGASPNVNLVDPMGAWDNFIVGNGAGARLTIGTQNIFMGVNAGARNTIGDSNTFIGFGAGDMFVDGDYNVHIGDILLGSSSHLGSGDYNILLGNMTGAFITQGSSNDLFGESAGKYIGAGNQTIAIGTQAGASFGSDTTITDMNNIFIGSYTGIGACAIAESMDCFTDIGGEGVLTSSGRGTGNVVLGHYAGQQLTTGASNVFLGFAAGNWQTTNSNLLIIDNQNRGSAVNEASTSLIYGTFAATAAGQILKINADTYLPVSYGSAAGSGGRTLKIGSDGKLWGDTSSMRYKHDIQPITTDNFLAILQAQAKTFLYNGSDTRDIGFIAEDLDQLGLKDLVVYDQEGRPDSIKYDRIPIYLTEVAKQQQVDIMVLQARLGITPSSVSINQSGTVGNGTVSTITDLSLQSSLVALGANLSSGIISLKEVIADKITVKTADVTQINLQKMQIVDQVTGEIYCTWIANGEWQKAKGECESVTVTNIITNAVKTNPVLTEAEVSQIAKQAVRQTTQGAVIQAQTSADIASTAATEAREASEQALDAAEIAVEAANQVTQENPEPAEPEVVPEAQPEQENNTGDLIQNAASSLLDGALRFTKWIFIEPIKNLLKLL